MLAFDAPGVGSDQRTRLPIKAGAAARVSHKGLSSPGLVLKGNGRCAEEVPEHLWAACLSTGKGLSLS